MEAPDRFRPDWRWHRPSRGTRDHVLASRVISQESKRSALNITSSETPMSAAIAVHSEPAPVGCRDGEPPSVADHARNLAVDDRRFGYHVDHRTAPVSAGIRSLVRQHPFWRQDELPAARDCVSLHALSQSDTGR